MARLVSVSGSLLGSALLLTLMGCAAGCKNQAPPAAEATAAEPAPAAPSAVAPAAPPAVAVADPAPAPATAATSKYSEAPFDLVIQAKGAYATGKAGEAEILISAKPPFHANDKYPYKFKLNEAPGLKFPNMVVEKDAVKVEKTRATLPVAFTPESAGKHTVSGKLFFSVCNDDQCLVEKRDLTLDVDVK